MSCESPYKTVTTSGTIITSPNYPEKYPNKANCKIRILFPESQRVAILFYSFEVEKCYIGCNCDWLKIRDGNSSNSNLIGSNLCGNTVPSPFISTGNDAILEFHTDGGLRYSGFKMVAYAIGNKSESLIHT